MQKTKLKVTEICKDIILVQSPSYKKLRQTWMRFEEAYENPVLNIKKLGKKFTKDDVLKWWKTTGEGKKHPYYFTGFNIPSYILGYFYDGMFDPLDQLEKNLLKTLKPFYETRKKFYIIGTFKTPKPDVIQHEIAHGFYYNSVKYRTDAKKIMAKLSRKVKTKIDNYLHKETGYGGHVLVDERHASILSDTLKELTSMGIKLSEIKVERTAMNKLYAKTYREMRKEKDKR
ncbi:MAG: hypothetical protein NUV57_03260 [archaeon]|nr:hypothetical protein [archaeon]